MIDLDNLEFRPGNIDDRMTLTTNIDYIPYNLENKVVKEVERFIEDIMPDSDVREYLLKISAVCMTRKTKLQKVWILTGEGDNGKSIYMDLLSSVLGDFSKTGKVTLVTRRAENANETNEAVSKLINARHVVLPEPGERDTIQADRIKFMCGGRDKIATRANYKSETEFVPDFKVMIVCNNIPKMSEDSYAIWKRIRVIHFPMMFCDDPDPEDPYQKLNDDNIADKFKTWAPYMAGYLIHWLEKYRNEGLLEPDSVIKKTQQYRDENDKWAEFREGYLVQDQESYIQWADLREVFRSWHDCKYKEKLKKRADDAKKYFDKHLGGYKDTHFKNVNLKGYIGWKLIDNLDTSSNK